MTRILACTALALAVLSRAHLTVWLGGWPVVTMPALTLVALFAATAVTVLLLLLWRFRVIYSRPAPWRTA